jgi:hypothetical protein
VTYLVGYGPHNNDRSAIELACQFARSEPQPVRAVSVVPQGATRSPAARTGSSRTGRRARAITAEEARADLAQHPASTAPRSG